MKIIFNDAAEINVQQPGAQGSEALWQEVTE